MGWDSSVSIATWVGTRAGPEGCRKSLLLPDQPWYPPSILYNAYRVFLGCKVVRA